MQQIERVAAIAQQAAELLPAAPAHWDVEGYMAWRELVWSTATRLSVIAGRSLDGRDPQVTEPALVGVITAHQLLDLACAVSRSRSSDDSATRGAEVGPHRSDIARTNAANAISVAQRATAEHLVARGDRATAGVSRRFAHRPAGVRHH